MGSTWFKGQQLKSTSHNLHLFASSSLLNSWAQTMIFTESLQATKNGPCTTLWSSAKYGLAPVNKRHRSWNNIFIRCCAYDGIEEELSINNCLNGTKWSTRNSLFNRWNDSTRQFKRKDLIDSMEFFCCVIWLIWPRKQFKRFLGKCCHTWLALPI